MDRTVKVLLTVIAAALWGLLLRPYLSLPAAQAAPSPPPVASLPAIALIPDTGNMMVVQDGTVYEVSHYPKLHVVATLKLK